MDDHKNSVMVAMLPITTDWAAHGTPHLTIVYAGQISDLRPSDFNEMAKAGSEMAAKYRPLQLRVLMPDVFGPPEARVDVLKLNATPQLMDIRNRFSGWDASNFPYVPHVTVGPVGSLPTVPPDMLAFDRLIVKWGEQEIKFFMNNSL